VIVSGRRSRCPQGLSIAQLVERGTVIVNLVIPRSIVRISVERELFALLADFLSPFFSVLSGKSLFVGI
jgi:hypothetical protein